MAARDNDIFFFRLRDLPVPFMVKGTAFALDRAAVIVRIFLTVGPHHSPLLLPLGG
jgi:hypothetical protein